jgi:ABC-2 type transport system permease protein
VADALTAEAAGASTREAAHTLIAMRRSLRRNAPGTSGLVPTLRAVGLLLAVGTLVLGLVPFDDPDRAVDLLATLVLGWLLGWATGPVAVRGAGQSLRPEWFALVPIPPRRLAAGLLAASFVGAAPLITLVAFAVLPLAASRFGVGPLLVAVPAALLELVLAVLLSRVVVAALAATLGSRRGQELGGVLVAAVIALASGGWSLATLVGQQLAEGPAPALGTALRVLPSGWGPLAIAAADRSQWLLAAGALLGLAALSGLLLLAWARLLSSTARKPAGGRAPGRAAGSLGAGLAAGPTGAVAVKELRSWRRDPGRRLLLLLAVLISGLNLAVPAVAFGAPAVLPWAALAALLFVSSGLANLYGEDGTALWLTRMVPGVETADVRGRQLAFLLVVGPPAVALALLLTLPAGQRGAWPYVLAVLPALLGGIAGLMVLLSVGRPVRQKDPRRRLNPFDTSDDPTTAGVLAGRGYLMLLLAALAATPAALVVLAGDLWRQPAVEALGVLLGVATGALLGWWGGRRAGRRLAERGAEVMDLLARGPREIPRPAAAVERPGGLPPRRTSALRGALWTVGIVCVVPQGLVPILFSLLGVDQQVRVWFAARYLPVGLQVPAAVGFIVVGLLAMGWAGAGTVTRWVHRGGRGAGTRR